MTINERVKMVRKELGLNQTDFGKRIAIAQGYLTNVENGRRDVTEKTIRLICLEFNVSENWLRTGEGGNVYRIRFNDCFPAFQRIRA